MIASYSLPIHVVSNQDVPHTTTDCLHYFFPTALAVIQQGGQMAKQLAEEIKENYIAPQASLLSIQACVTAILEVYRTRHPQSMHVDLSEDYRIYTSFNHLQYALIHVLRFLQAHHLGNQVSVWTTRKEGIHMRLSGQALLPSLIHELCTLFPPKATAKHPGLAISKILIEAQGGRLLYITNGLPQDPYTEFIIVIPPAEEMPSTSRKAV